MKKTLFAVLLTFGSLASASTWSNVALVDQQCSRKVADNPDAHTRDCALGCSKSGFGIVTSDGKFLKFDKAGNKQAMNLLQQTDKKDHLRVTVDGVEKGGIVNVKSVKLD